MVFVVLFITRNYSGHTIVPSI